MTAAHRPDATADLTAALRERVLVLDGAMGTMIQGYGLSEADYRGDRLADHPDDQQGKQRLVGAPPSPTSSPPSTAPTSRRGAWTCSRPTLLQRAADPLADYGMQEVAYELNVAAAGARARRVRCDDGPAPRTARVACPRDGGTDELHGIHLLSTSTTPGPAKRHLRRARRGLPRAGREGFVDGADVPAQETIFDTLNARRRSTPSRPRSRRPAGAGR